MTAILSVQVRHQVQFAPNPKNTAFPTPPVFVETRLVRDIKEFPEKVKYVTFLDVVETVVLLPNSDKKTLYSSALNEEHFHVVWNGSGENFRAMRTRMKDEERLVEIHPDYNKNTLLVYTLSQGSRKSQQAA